MGVDAREFFEGVADAVRRHREAELILQFGSPSGAKVGSGGGYGDGPVVARIMSDERALGVLRETERVIGDGLRYIAGLRLVWSRKADVIEMHYVDLMPWADVAAELHIDRRTAMRWRDDLFAWCDLVGWAHVAAGMGNAEA